MNPMPDSLATLAPALANLDDAWIRYLDQIGVGVLVKDLTSGRYVFASPAAQGVLLSTRELPGTTDSDVFDAVQAVALRAADQQALALGSAYSAEHRIERNGERREYQVWRHPLPATDTQGARILSCWQDLTDQRKREQQLQAALEQLEQQQRANADLRREMQDNQVRDNVSGLYHRAHFEEQLRREADLSSREQREFAIRRFRPRDGFRESAPRVVGKRFSIDAENHVARMHPPAGGRARSHFRDENLPGIRRLAFP